MPQRDRPAVLKAYRDHLNRGLAMVAELTNIPVEHHALGAHVFDDHQTKYLQCGGYGVFLLGHCHPDVIAAVRRQLDRMPLNSRLLLSAETAAAAAALAEVAPDGMDYVYFGTSGTEATETAIKLARLHGKDRLVSTRGGFHGKTMGALSVTGRTFYRAPFEPLLGGVQFVEFGEVAPLEAALTEADGRGCVILEPVQAEGGVRVPPDGYLHEAAELCRATDAFLIVDEIQTGLGRLGEWWGVSAESVVPDVLLVGKTLSGGVVPISAAVASERAFGALNRDPVLHSATFSGAPVTAAAALATIEVIKRDGLVDRSRKLGQRILEGAREALADCGAVTEVRGRGLLIGIEFSAPLLAAEFMAELLNHRVLVSHSSNAHEVVRLTPPAILEDSDVQWLLEALSAAGDAVNALEPEPSVSGRI